MRRLRRLPVCFPLLGLSWGHLGALMGRVGALLGRLGALLGRLGALLKAYFPVLLQLLAPLEPSTAVGSQKI